MTDKKEQLDEASNKANKIKKSEHEVARGLIHPASVDPEFHYAISKQSHGKAYAANKVIGRLKSLGRESINSKTPGPHEHHAKYDSKHGSYDIVHSASNKTVAVNVSNSGGHAMSIANNYTAKSKAGKLKEEAKPLRAIIEELKHQRGRPKKKRNLEGDIVDDEKQ